MSAKSKKSQQQHFKLKHFYYVVLSAFATLPAVSAATPAIPNRPFQYFALTNASPYQPRTTLNAQGGSYWLGQLDLLYPLLSDHDSLFFFDARYKATTQHTREYNLALGYRRLVFNNNHIAGGYIWIDRARSNHDNYFSQVTLGGEFLGEIYDFRGNVYLPYGNTSQFVGTSTSPIITGHTVGVADFGFNEQALPGFDVEVGRAVPHVDNLRLFADYYHFGSDEKRINGGRVRGEYYYNYNLTLTASYSYDNVRQGMGFVGVRLSLGGVDHPTPAPMQGRMEDFIIRDNDIITFNQSTPPKNTLDTRPYWFVDNAAPAGGDGTFEHPFNTEQQAEFAAGNNSVIYTFQGNAIYPLPAGGLNIKPAQFFTASGGDLTFRNVVILARTTAPVLNGRINVANAAKLSNFTLSGVGSTDAIGIYGNGVANVTLSNLTIQNFTGASQNGADASGVGNVSAEDGGIGGDAAGIRIINSTKLNLESIRVTNITGGDAKGGDAYATGPAYITQALGGDGGYGGDATGIDLHGSSAKLNNITVMGIRGGSSIGGDASAHSDTSPTYITGARAGSAYYGGNAKGIDLYNGSAQLSNINVSQIFGGSAIGGDASSTGSGSTIIGNYASGGHGNLAGFAIGIDVGKSYETPFTTASLSNVNVSTIVGGSGIGGDASASESFSYASGGNGGGGGQAIGISGAGSPAVGLTNIHVSGIVGGSANGGDGTATNATSGVLSYGGNGGFAGAATGIDLSLSHAGLSNIFISGITGGNSLGGDATSTNGSTVTSSTGGNAFIGGSATGIQFDYATGSITNASITNITGGAANGGDAQSNGTTPGFSYSEGGSNNYFGGTAIGINLSNAIATLNQVNIANLLGGSANGGNASGVTGAVTTSSVGGDGGHGGDAFGLLTTGGAITPVDVTFTNLVGGTANAGTGNTVNGTPGTPGQAANVQP